ncbi:DUF1289 domain-containing protein [Marinomonas algarum]|uniref:DUF1289 domain-containing protein n=1 Tax=Marinomonas algarum TaxID=2883105 RepID=A0A9X1IKQ3_9GAMM|nr:DUF1289 domain-containing protein [Marinomonas algarum]MCB5160667.1 DUF1289 domain-containing protein [Marinomonas algarum]
MPESKPQMTSPCVSICLLNDDDVCVGCYRTGQEISVWGRLDYDAQYEIMKKVREREAKSQLVG